MILGSPKSCMGQIVSKFDSYKNGVYYEGIIHSEYIMGYFSKDALEFIQNDDYSFDTTEYGSFSL